MIRLNPPLVVAFDPITWVDEWSYEVERKGLQPHGVDLVVPADHAERDAVYPDADVLIVSGVERLTADHISRLNRCVGILCYSAGMDQVDSQAAAAAGIPVGNIRAGTADVADHAMALLLAAQRQLVTMTAATAARDWDLASHPEFRSIRRVTGTTLGIVGAGAIGQAIAQRARGFDMTTIATYRRPPAEPDPLLPHVPLKELFATADSVVLAAALTETSRGMIDRKVLGHATPGTVLVNIARGGLIVEDDLVAALDEGRIGIAALDVRHPEPPDPASDRLTGRADVIQTPHMGGMSVEAMTDLHRLAAETALTMLREAQRL